MHKAKRQVAERRIKYAKLDHTDEDLMAEYISKIDLGPLENIFFYLVLDNVKALFKLER